MKSGSSRVGLPLFSFASLGRARIRALTIVAVVGLFVFVGIGHEADASDELIPIGNAPSDAEANKKIIDSMRDRGDDLSRPTEIDFYFYVPPMASNRVASDVRGMGFHAEIRETISDGGAYNGDTLVYVSTHHVISLAYLNRVDRSFKAEAKRYGGTYDGWEAVDPRPLGQKPKSR